MKNTEIYFKIVGDNYKQLKKEFSNYCRTKGFEFREDDYSQSILDVHTSIEKGNFKKELNYSNIKNYLFISFRNQCSKYLKSMDMKKVSLDTPIDEEGRTLLDKISEQIDDYDIEELENEENTEIKVIFNILKIIENEFGIEEKQIYLRVLRGDKLSDISKDFNNARGRYLKVLYWLQNNLDYNNIKNETTN